MMNLNPKKVQQAMKRMGISQVDIPANEVIIKSDDKEIVISNPQVAKVNMMGQETFQVTGNIAERAVSSEPEINEEDIKTVMEQAGVDRENALKAIEDSEGDLAQAILNMKKTSSEP
jgi:nascent polypeptide-associated complex subunit alpha